ALAALFDDKGSREGFDKVAQSSSVLTFESPESMDIIINGQNAKLRGRCVFQSVSKNSLDTAMTLLKKAPTAESLRKDIDSLTKDTGERIVTTLAADLLLLDAAWNSNSTAGRLISTASPNVLDFIGLALAQSEPSQSEGILQAMQTKIGSEKIDQIRSAYLKHKSEISSKANKTTEARDATQLSMEAWYRVIFSAQYVALDDDASLDEISLNDRYFVIKGHSEAKTPSGRDITIYFLRIGIRTEDRIFVVGYYVPVDNELTDVRAAMSMVKGFRVLK